MKKAIFRFGITSILAIIVIILVSSFLTKEHASGSALQTTQTIAGAQPGAAGAQPGAQPGAAGAQPGAQPGAAGAQPGAQPGAAGAQPGAAGAQPGAAGTAGAKQTPTVTPVKVICAYRFGFEKCKEDSDAGIGQVIVVKVRNLQTLLDRAKCLDEKKQPFPKCQEQNIALYLNGRKMEDIFPESIRPNTAPDGEGELQFHLQRSAKSDEAWADLLGAPSLNGEFFKKPKMEVSVGLEKEHAEDTEEKAFNLIRIYQSSFWVCSSILILLLWLLWKYGKNSDLLRDAGPLPSNGLRPYSLARCQMAFWFFLVITSFLYIWQITGATDIITPSVLALIGIGAGTALGAAAIDVSKRDAAASESRQAKAEAKTMSKELAELKPQIAAAPTNGRLQLETKSAEKETQLNVIESKIASLDAVIGPHSSKSFWRDLLNDDGSMSLHRLQMLVWTLVLGWVFLHSVWSRMSMPQFSETLLALLGISAGPYLGFKIPEKKV